MVARGAGDLARRRASLRATPLLAVARGRLEGHRMRLQVIV